MSFYIVTIRSENPKIPNWVRFSAYDDHEAKRHVRMLLGDMGRWMHAPPILRPESDKRRVIDLGFEMSC